MKKTIFLFILILLVPFSLAKTEKINMLPGDSRLIESFNVSLINLNTKENKIIICVNNQKLIIEEDTKKTIDKLRINVLDIKDNYVRLELKSDCKDCVCGPECSNAACFPKPEVNQEENETELPNPASVYCEQQGGILDIRTLEDGSQIGYCIFSNYECEEWAYYRGECPKETVEKTFWEKIIFWFESIF